LALPFCPTRLLFHPVVEQTTVAPTTKACKLFSTIEIHEPYAALFIRATKLGIPAKKPLARLATSKGFLLFGDVRKPPGILGS
jgi:hypothetical protein